MDVNKTRKYRVRIFGHQSSYVTGALNTASISTVEKLKILGKIW